MGTEQERPAIKSAAQRASELADQLHRYNWSFAGAEGSKIIDAAVRELRRRADRLPPLEMHTPAPETEAWKTEMLHLRALIQSCERRNRELCDDLVGLGQEFIRIASRK